MDLQEIVALTIVVLTAAIMGYKCFRKRRFSCCQCTGKRSGSMVFSIKKGEKPIILTRW
ncbi:MAG TPA: hypothetical protein PLW02_11155 [Verrucomicrobiota bacterium]|nr:hypothetical protein [Verrucomicrobiota bacterium]